MYKIALIIISILVSIISSALAVRAYKIRKNYVLIQGRVIAHDGKGRDGWSPVISFFYAGQEIVYVSDVGSAWTAKLPIGATCPIYVNPNDKYEIHDARLFYFWFRAITPSFFGLTVAFLAYRDVI